MATLAGTTTKLAKAPTENSTAKIPDSKTQDAVRIRRERNDRRGVRKLDFESGTLREGPQTQTGIVRSVLDR